MGSLNRGGAAIHFSLTTFERRRDKVVTGHVFARRMLRAIGLWFVIVGVGLVIGIAGYAGFEGLSLTDAYLNAAMILSGMGPVDKIRGPVAVLGAVWIGRTRLIDNVVCEPPARRRRAKKK